MDVTIDCICPGARHPDGDTITLRDSFGFHDATALRKDMSIEIGDDTTGGDSLAVLTEGYLLRGITGWTLVDERGKPVPASKAEIRERLLTNLDAAMTVADAADELYGPSILLPLVKRAARLSPPTPTDEPTSPPSDSPNKSPKPSKQSSTTTTPTDDTAPITPLPVGGSRSSQNSASAA